MVSNSSYAALVSTTPRDEGVLFRNTQTPHASPGCSRAWLVISRIFAVLIVLFLTFPQQIPAYQNLLYYDDSLAHVRQGVGSKSMLEARAGYMLGFNNFLFRDGDNGNTRPSTLDLGLDSIIFGVQGETFATDDLAVRGQAWINIPQESRSDFVLDGKSLGWDTQSRYIQADLAAIYHIGLRGMPYAAGLVAGARYNNLDCMSKRVAAPGGTFNNHLHVYIPYTGVYYAHNEFLGSVLRLDVFFSPFTFSRLDGWQNLPGETMHVDGHSITGLWFETLFEWSLPVGESALIGAVAKVNYLKLSGGATLDRSVASQNYSASTRFSMDGWNSTVVLGLGLTYMF